MSRSAFALAFHRAVGETPLQHLCRWRCPGVALAEIAAEVGDHNEAAFNVAFRREVRAPPGTGRSQQSA